MIADFFKEYQRAGLIKRENIGFDQVATHMGRAHKDLRVAQATKEVDASASYNYAYLAMLRTGRALMFSYGFRPIDGCQHKTVTVFAEKVLGDDFTLIVRRFDRMRQKRNRFTYDEPELLVSQNEVEGAFAVAQEFVRRVADFIQQKTPQQKFIL
jgi:uncharacterized protein (UPF0332 family)